MYLWPILTGINLLFFKWICKPHESQLKDYRCSLFGSLKIRLDSYFPAPLPLAIKPLKEASLKSFLQNSRKHLYCQNTIKRVKSLVLYFFKLLKKLVGVPLIKVRKWVEKRHHFIHLTYFLQSPFFPCLLIINLNSHGRRPFKCPICRWSLFSVF